MRVPKEALKKSKKRKAVNDLGKICFNCGKVIDPAEVHYCT